MHHLLKQKTAVITGGTSGIGKAIASLYVEQGASVVIIGTNLEKAEKIVADLQSKVVDPSQKITHHLVDVSNYALVESTFNQILTQFGRVDLLVNNAGITRDQLLLRMSEEDWDQVIAVNLKSIYNTCHAVIRSMMKTRGGSIINISSVIGLIGNAGQANYAASKAGMIGFTKSLAKELASRGIRANCIAPGYIETPMTDQLSSSIKEQVLAKIPLGRIGDPLDIARAALYLGSDLSSYVTGQVLTVDGGMVI